MLAGLAAFLVGYSAYCLFFAGDCDDDTDDTATTDSVELTDGPDLIDSTNTPDDEGPQEIFTLAGNDTVSGGGGNDTIYAGNDDDFTNGGQDDDAVFGGAGNDDVRGGPGLDAVFGGAGDDTVLGGQGGDLLHGNSGDDRLEGGIEADLMFGGEGADTLFGSAGEDFLVGGDQYDREFTLEDYETLRDTSDPLVSYDLDISADDTAVNILDGGAGNDELLLTSNDQATGGDGADAFYLSAGMTASGAANITDFNAADDTLVVYYDDTTAVPSVTIDATGALFLNGSAAASATGLVGVDPATIQFVPVPAPTA